MAFGLNVEEWIFRTVDKFKMLFILLRRHTLLSLARWKSTSKQVGRLRAFGFVGTFVPNSVHHRGLGKVFPMPPVACLWRPFATNATSAIEFVRKSCLRGLDCLLRSISQSVQSRWNSASWFEVKYKNYKAFPYDKCLPFAEHFVKPEPNRAARKAGNRRR